MYNYTPKEVGKILSNYKKIDCFKYDNFNQDNADLLLDLEQSLKSRHLSGDHLSVLFCFYTLELNLMESSILLSKEPKEISELKKGALLLLSNVLNGYKTKYRIQEKNASYTLILTLERIQAGELSVLADIPLNVQLDLLEFLKDNYDRLAKNAFDFLVFGKITDEEEINDDSGDEYPSYDSKEDGGRDHFSTIDQRNKVHLLDSTGLSNLSKQKKPARKRRTAEQVN